MLSKGDVLKLDYAYHGAPFVRWIGADIDTGTLDYAYGGKPYCSFLEEDFILVELAGSIAGESGVSGELDLIVSLSGSIDAVSECQDADLTYAVISELSGLVRGKSKTLTGELIPYSDLAGRIDAVSNIGTAVLSMSMSLAGTMAGESLLSATLGFLWEEIDEPDWIDWEDREGDIEELWILRTDAADNTWTARTDAADDLWILRTDADDNSWTERT